MISVMAIFWVSVALFALNHQAVRLTLPRVRQIGNSLGHDNRHVNVALDAVHAQLDK